MSRADPTNPTAREIPDGDQVPRPVLLRVHRGRHHRPHRPVPEAEQPGRGGDRRRGGADRDRDQPRPRRPRRRPACRWPSGPAPQCVSLVELANWMGEQGDRERQRPELRRHRLLRLGLDQVRPRLAHQHAARRHRDRQPGRDADQPRRQDDLPRRRHLPLRRHEADRRTQPGRHRRSCRSAATTRWTATTPWSPPSSSAPRP